MIKFSPTPIPYSTIHDLTDHLSEHIGETIYIERYDKDDRRTAMHAGTLAGVQMTTSKAGDLHLITTFAPSGWKFSTTGDEISRGMIEFVAGECIERDAVRINHTPKKANR